MIARPMRSPTLLASVFALAPGLQGQCVAFSAFSPTGSLPSNLQPPGTASQVSGMAASRHNPDVLWIHDDGGVGHPQIIALRRNGALAQQYTLAGVANRDWEEITIGPGPNAGRDYLYVADTGNNSMSFTTFSLLRVAEPDVPPAPGSTVSLTPEVFRFRYPTGTFNAETLWIDPADGTPYVLTKENGSACSLFRYPLPLDAGVEKVLALVVRLQGMPTQLTGGAVSQDGRVICARNPSVILTWSRAAGASFATAFASTPCTVNAGQQGLAEAISFAADGRSLWAISEGVAAPILSSALTFPAGVPVAFAFGTGLRGAAGVPGLGATAAPRLGGPPLLVGGWQCAAGAPAVAVVSATGFDDGAVPVFGGWLHAAPDVVFFAAAAVDGTLALSFGNLPDRTSLYGLPISAQLLVVDPQAVQGVAMSAGLRLVLDR
jgi:hypothetical protein